MKPGVVCTALLVVAGAAGGVTLTLKDQSKLEAAQTSCDRGLKALESGDEAAARKAFKASQEAADNVSPFTGLRQDALVAHETSRSCLHILDALDKAEEHPLQTLRAVEGQSPLPPRAADVVKGIRARLLLESARALELQDATRQAARAYGLAVKMARESKSPALKEAERGSRRVTLLVNLRAAEAALKNRNEEEAGQLAQAARETIAHAESPFDDPTRIEGLKRRVDSILAEVKSGKLLGRYEARLDELYRDVDSPKLGTLLKSAQGLRAPKLAGGHPRAGAHEKRLLELVRRHKRVTKVSKEFQGMVLASRSGGVTVFVDKTEVTGKAFAEFIADGGYKNEDLWSSEGRRRLDRFLDRDRKERGPKTFRNGRPPKGWDLHPVTGVTFHEAEAYAKWRGKRLPTTAEWQAAASRGTAYPWGDEYKSGRANVRGRAKPKLEPVGGFPDGAGPTGSLDMIGNAREIVRWGRQKYKELGGSYKSLPENSTIRSGAEVSAFKRTTDMGFRCAKELRWDG